MVDMSTYNKLHSKEPAALTGRDDLGDFAMKQAQPPSSEFLSLLPAKIPGFGFHNKIWGKYRISVAERGLG